jgi:cytochrome bd ubiquinol oxidase subunit II
MHLYEIPMICVLIGLALYAVLGGADFGAGLWQLATLLDPRKSKEATRRATLIREHAHHSMGPVWEANHVWLIFVLTVTWTAYPTAFGAIASTLAVPLLIAGLGVVFRGVAYALRAGTAEPRELARIDTIFALSSLLTPFALGAMIGAIASGRVPVGNARGGLFSSWLNPTSALTGVLAITVGAYLAAVYLAADADRGGKPELADAFRARALLTALIAGAIALAGLAVLHSDAHRIFTRLTDGPGLVGLIISVAGGLATVSLVIVRRYALARVSAALAVAGMIVGWALAQQPLLLPHLTVQQAAAPHESLVLVLVAIAMGAAILFPSLGLLFGLLLGGRFDDATTAEDGDATKHAHSLLSAAKEGLHARLAFAGLLGGLGFLTAAEAPWAHGIGVVCLFAAMVLAFLAVDPARIASVEEERPVRPLRRPGR